MSDSLRPHGLYSPWNSPGQNIGVGSLSLLQGIFPTQRRNPRLLHLLHWWADSLPLAPPERPYYASTELKCLLLRAAFPNYHIQSKPPALTGYNFSPCHHWSLLSHSYVSFFSFFLSLGVKLQEGRDLDSFWIPSSWHRIWTYIVYLSKYVSN